LVRNIISPVLVFTICTFSHAQKIPFQNYTIQHGLPQSTVYDIEQDLDGYLWFATQGGAARFDGYEFEYFNTSNGLPDDFVNCILIDRNGVLWMGTESGIASYDGVQVSAFPLNHLLVDKRVDRMIEDSNGNIWITTAYGISVLFEDTIYSYTMEDALIGYPDSELGIFPDSKGRVHVATNPGLTIFQSPDTYEQSLKEELIQDIIETSSGEIWYASQENGIFVRKDDDSMIRLGYDDGLKDEMVISLMEDHSGKIWCGTYVDGLYVYENGRFESVKSGYSSEPIARFMYEDRNHRIWIQTFYNGLWLIDDGDFLHITISNNLVDDGVEDIFEDSFGSIWLATVGGVSKYGRVLFEAYDLDYGLPDNYVVSVFRDSQNRIWMGTFGLDLLYYQNGKMYLIDEQFGFPGERMPLSFAEDQNKHIYIGTDKELFYFNGRTLRTVDIGLHWQNSRINSLIIAPDQKLWCATDSGVYMYQNGNTTLLGANEGLINPFVYDLKIFNERVFCATKGGISIFDLNGQHTASVTMENGLASDDCRDLTIDIDGNVWIATNRGVSKLEMDNATFVINFGPEAGLISNSTQFVEFADSKSLWIGTDRGINVLNTETEEIDYYGEEDGFNALETNLGAISRGEHGELWIGTVAGIVHYNPKYNIVDTKPPDLILFAPLVDGKKYEFDYNRQETGVRFPGEPALPYSKYSLTFNFTGIQTTIPSQNYFRYYLEGFEDDWSVPRKERSVTYKRLPSGQYVFRVKAYNLDGIGVTEEASFSFIIKPPFWKTIWFIMLEVLAGLSLIYATIKYREQQLIKEKKILETKVKERTREIEDQKVEIEAQRDEISEQKYFVEEQRDHIAFQNKEITDSILYAKRIQQAVLPGKLTLTRTLPEHFILLKPRDIVSGDYYWVEEKNDRVIVCAADCTGHGVPGAFMSLLGLTFLNEIVNKDEIVKAADILNRLRMYIIRSMSHKHEEASQGRDGMDLSLIVIDSQLKMLEYAGAYNPLVIVRNGELIEYKADKMPIGRHVGEEGPFTNHKIDIQDQDMIYLFSDGFPDQFGGEKGSKYKAKPFKRFLQRISPDPIKKQHEQLEAELKSWMGGEEQVDDILVIGIRYHSRN